MSKMKHLLRKLHIGIDHNPHQHLHHHASAAATTPGQPTSSSLSPSSPPSDSSSASSLSTAAERGLVGRARSTDLIDRMERVSGLPTQESPNNHTDSALDFNSVEEEFQVQLALALSASDSEGRKAEDPESDQINAARQLSLGCPLSVADSERLGEFLSLKYWNYNVVHYDEKIVDGFYDVYAIQSRSTFQGQLPLLVDLQAVSILDNVDHEVILVNRSIDSQLRCLENKAYALSRECGVLGPGFLLNGVIQRLAELVVDCLGGPVGNAEEITKKWSARNVELRSSLSTIVLPLGFLNVGLSRHRALLFKVLADRINLPCMLVKGSLYTGSDDGAVNLIKTVDGSEYIIDLMGAPGALIPAEIPSSFLLDSILGAKVVPDNGDILNNFRFNLNGTASTLPPLEEDPAACGLTMEAAKSLDTHSPEADNILLVTKEDVRLEEFDKHVQPDDGLCITVSSKTEELSTVQEKRVKDVSKYVISAAKDPEFAQKLHAVLLESGASPPPDLFTGMNPVSSSERKLIEQIQAVEGEINRVKVSTSPNQYWSNNELSLLPPSGAQLLDIIGFADNIEHGYVGPAMQLVANPIDSQSCCKINQEGVWGFAAEVNNILSDDLKVDPPCGIDVHETEMLLAENEPGRLPSFKLTGIVDEGLHPHTNLSENKEINPLFGEVADWEIPWEDLEIGDRVGIGSYGEVYHGDWNGTEVAVKKFLVQDFSCDVLLQFKCEAELMIRLTHPNVVLFMGAVTRPPHLSILTEYLPRGSLYRLLHRSSAQIDDTRRMKMALDVAKGMNYLHTSHPTIVHRDLKTPNLLVDNNWVVKVCDFGLSRLKHHTFLSSKSTAGTPEWMAPEVLRNERASEKCDVYSFGVILWELATLQMPWSGLNPMQVVGAVGFQNKRLEIPSEVDPSVAQIIRDCWENDPSLRPSFSQLISRLRGLKRLVQSI